MHPARQAERAGHVVAKWNLMSGRGASPTKPFFSWYSWVDSNHRPPDPQSYGIEYLEFP